MEQATVLLGALAQRRGVEMVDLFLCSIDSDILDGPRAEFPGFEQVEYKTTKSDMKPDSHKVYTWLNSMNRLSPADIYNRQLRNVPKSCTSNPVVAYTHNDVTVHDEDWLDWVTRPFEFSSVAAVGFGGALRLGNMDLLRKPYDIRNMARIGYHSNQTDAEVHGARTKESMNVAVLDAFFMAVRADWLISRGGWPTQLTHHCLDLWLACALEEDGLDTVVVPVSCTHHGGGTSTKPEYARAKWLQGGTLETDHSIPHRWIYNNYRHVLPIIGGQHGLGL